MPLAQACHLWPRELRPSVLSSDFVSAAGLASLSEASAQFPEFTWLACPQLLALPEQSGARTCAPPHAGSGLQAGEPLSWLGAYQGGEGRLRLCPCSHWSWGGGAGHSGGPWGSRQAWRWGIWLPFLFGCYKDRPCKAVLASAQIGLVLGLCPSLLPSAHGARGGGIANDRQCPAWVGAFVHSHDGGHFLGACSGPGLRGRPPMAGGSPGQQRTFQNGLGVGWWEHMRHARKRGSSGPCGIELEVGTRE